MKVSKVIKLETLWEKVKIRNCVYERGNSIKIHYLVGDLALGILQSVAEDTQLLLTADNGQFLLKAYSRLT